MNIHPNYSDRGPITKDAFAPCPCEACSANALLFSRKISEAVASVVMETNISAAYSLRAGALIAAMRVTMLLVSPSSGASREEHRATWLRIAAEAFDQSIEREERAKGMVDAMIAAGKL